MDIEAGTDLAPPTLQDIALCAARIAPFIDVTPIWRWQGREIVEALPDGAEVWLKLELFQRSGTFKARAALQNMLSLDACARERGVTAVSAGNHAIAVAFAARRLAMSAKVVMQASANPARVAAARAYGAEVVFAQDGEAAFELAGDIARAEGRSFIHPFEGKGVALGTGTLGAEFLDQAGAFDLVILPVGGGGLAGGVATAIKGRAPGTVLIGVEPEGAASMSESFKAGGPVRLEQVSTIADSLAPPMALPYSYGLCRRFLDEMVVVSDAQIARAVALIFRDLKLAVEPAAAAATAALLGPLRDRAAGKRVGIIICGTNIDAATHAKIMAMGASPSSDRPVEG